ncbi:protein of unknown function [Burkholderia multivorans]
MWCSRGANRVELRDQSGAHLSSVVKPLEVRQCNDAGTAQPIVVDILDAGRGKAQRPEKTNVPQRAERAIRTGKRFSCCPLLQQRVHGDSRGCQELRPTHKHIPCCVSRSFGAYKTRNRVEFGGQSCTSPRRTQEPADTRVGCRFPIRVERFARRYWWDFPYEVQPALGSVKACGDVVGVRLFKRQGFRKPLGEMASIDSLSVGEGKF